MMYGGRPPNAWMIVTTIWRGLGLRSKTAFIAVLFAIILAAAVYALMPLLFAKLLDTLGALARKEDSDQFNPWFLVFVYVVAFAVSRALSDAQWIVLGSLEQGIFNVLRLQFLRHLHSLPHQFIKKKKLGELDEMLGQAITGARSVIFAFVFTLLPVVVELLAVFIACAFALSLKYAVIIALTALSYMASVLFATNYLARYRDRAQRSLVDARGAATDFILNLETTKIMACAPSIEGLYEETLTEVSGAFHRFFRRRAIVSTVQCLLLSAGFATLNYAAVADVSITAADTSLLVMLNMFFFQTIEPLQQLSLSIRDVEQGGAALSRLAEALAAPAERAGGTRPTSSRVAYSLAVSDLSVEIDGHAILSNISFEVPSGSTLAIVGESGAGKSTLFNAMIGFIEPTRGDIQFDGTSLRDQDLGQLRTTIAAVPQSVSLYNDTVRANILMGCDEIDRRRYRRVLTQARIPLRWLRQSSGQWSSHVGDLGGRLSGGERQRVAIARAFMKSPRLLILDEPSSSLDSVTEEEILGSIRQEHSIVTTIIISHRLRQVTSADQILVLRHGVIVERGTHEELLQLRGYYRQMFDSQQVGGPTAPEKIDNTL